VSSVHLIPGPSVMSLDVELGSEVQNCLSQASNFPLNVCVCSFCLIIIYVPVWCNNFNEIVIF
jgi:hypothetical protein